MKIKPFLLGLLLCSFAHSQTVIVEWNKVHQPIHGFGASDAWFSDEIMTHPQKDEILDLLFDKNNGAGLSILRHRIPPEQNAWNDGFIELSSGDLDFGTRPYHGVRFTGIAIPKAATIDSAYIQFTSHNDLSGPSELTILAEAADDAPTFNDNAKNISSRTVTIDSVQWPVPAWKDQERGDAQRTPDIKDLIQKIVDRDGWQSGNSLVLIFKNLTGKRSADTFDAGAEHAPELFVYFNSTESVTKRVITSTDDAEENGKSYLSHGADVTREAFARGCETVWAAAWTPPAEWKTSGQLNQGGHLKEEHYQDWADYLERYRLEMENRSGIPLFGISPQNEPGRKPWESCQWSATDFREFIKNNLGPTLDPNCKIIVPEETNWNNVDNFYHPIHDDMDARGYVDIIAGHVYGGDPNVSYNHFGKPVWETEWSYDTSRDDQSIQNGLTWAINFWRLLVNAEVSACHHWWLVNFQNDGRQQGLITAAPAQSGLKVAKRLWTIGNYSKFVRPGWHRIDATKIPALALYVAAFKDSTTNDFAITAINSSSEDQTVTFRFDGFISDRITPHRTSAKENLNELESMVADSSFTATLAAKSMTTFIGTASPLQTGVKDRTPDPLSPALFRLAGNYPNPFNPSTTIRYSLTAPAEVILEIFDLRGRKKETLVNQTQPPGEYHVQWNTAQPGSNIASGVYFYRLRAKAENQMNEQTRKMLFVK